MKNQNTIIKNDKCTKTGELNSSEEEISK